MGIDIPSPRRSDPGYAGGPDHERGRARVPRADLELEAGRRPEGPAPDLCGLPLVHRPEPPPGQPGGPGGRGAAEDERQRAEALSSASAPGRCGGGRGDPPGEVHTPVGGVVRRDDRVDGSAGRRGAWGAVGRDRHGGGAVDDSGFEDEGRARVLRPVEHGCARRTRAGADAFSRIVAGVPLEDRRDVAEERAGVRASTSRGRLDGSRVPFERTVVDGRVRGPSGGRGGPALCPCAPESGGSGLSAIRSAGAPRPSPSGVERLRHLAIGRPPEADRRPCRGGCLAS